jgi:hypothetical protein
MFDDGDPSVGYSGLTVWCAPRPGAANLLPNMSGALWEASDQMIVAVTGDVEGRVRRSQPYVTAGPDQAGRRDAAGVARRETERPLTR